MQTHSLVHTFINTVVATATVAAAAEFMGRRLHHLLLRGNDADARAAQVRLELEEQRKASALQQQHRAVLLAAQ